MPYMIGTADSCPADKPHAVMKADSGEVMGCHETEADANKQMAALHVNEKMSMNAAPREPMIYRSIPAIAEYEIRTVGDASPRFVGYAAVFNADSEPLPFVETIQPGAFARSLKSDRDHTFVMDHDDTRLLASRRAKTLTIVEDARGLLVEADLPNTSYARDLVELHDRGEARSMSFTFRVTKGGEMWSADNKRRTLTDVKLGHVAVLTGLPPAYRQTTASIRSLAYAIGTDADALASAIEDLRDGRPLSAESVALLQSVIAELREQPVETPLTEAPAAVLSLSVARARLALMSQVR